MSKQRKKQQERQQGDPYFEDILFLWLENNQIRRKGSTNSKYRYLIDRHILPHLGAIRMSELNAGQINAFLTEKMSGGRLNRPGGLSPSYVRSIMLIINGALKFAVSEQLCTPLKSPIFRPPVRKKEQPVLSLQCQRQVESYIFKNTDLTGMGILLSLHTGLRIGEICALTWGDIDLDKRILHVRHTISRIKNTDHSAGKKSILVVDEPKTKSSARDIPIPSAIFSVLRMYASEYPDQFVVSGSDHFISPRTFEYRYHRLLEKCGVPQVNFHALRHTFATRCIEAGVDVKTLSEILGHASVGITLNTYVHSSMDFKRIQIEKVASLSA